HADGSPAARHPAAGGGSVAGTAAQRILRGGP
ncbi:hypothetical protein NJB1808_01800, partial [Mycobacterium marinum]